MIRTRLLPRAPASTGRVHRIMKLMEALGGVRTRDLHLTKVAHYHYATKALFFILLSHLNLVSLMMVRESERKKGDDNQGGRRGE